MNSYPPASVRVRLLLAIALANANAVPAAAQALQSRDTIVKQVGAPRHRAVARLTEELSIGTVDQALEYTFTAVSEIVVMRDGSVLVLDGSAGSDPMLRQYDPRGRYLRTIGRRGRGPGEYMGAGGLTQLSDGRILLLDAGNRRINVYDANGETADSWPLANFFLSAGGRGGLRAGAGDIVYVRAGVPDPNATRAADRLRNRRDAIIRFRANGTILDTIFEPDIRGVPDFSVAKTQATNTGTSTLSVTVPYTPAAVWAWSPHGFMITGITGRYAFELRLPPATTRAGTSPLWRPGDPVISVRREFSPIAVSREERDEQRVYLEKRLAAAPGQLSRAIPDVPRQKPAYKRIVVADDGRVWIHVSTPSERYSLEQASPGGPPVSIGGGSRSAASSPSVSSVARPLWRESDMYDVYDPDATYIGRVALPPQTTLLAMNGDIVWGVTADELGVQYVKRFRIAWGP